MWGPPNLKVRELHLRFPVVSLIFVNSSFVVRDVWIIPDRNFLSFLQLVIVVFSKRKVGSLLLATCFDSFSPNNKFVEIWPALGLVKHSFCYTTVQPVVDLICLSGGKRWGSRGWCLFLHRAHFKTGSGHRAMTPSETREAQLCLSRKSFYFTRTH